MLLRTIDSTEFAQNLVSLEPEKTKARSKRLNKSLVDRSSNIGATHELSDRSEG